MAKKADEGEVKKECPSCGLGVALDSKICEFCGWDFDEEDEWILQIEKLERDLLLEKQKFEPGSVEDKIESTLRSPFYQKEEPTAATAPPKATPKAAVSPTKQVQKPAVSVAPPVREVKASGVKVVKPMDTVREPEPVVRTAPRAPPPAVQQPPKPVRAPVIQEEPSKAEPAPASAAAKAAAPKTKKTRVVRKVKQA